MVSGDFLVAWQFMLNGASVRCCLLVSIWVESMGIIVYLEVYKVKGNEANPVH